MGVYGTESSRKHPSVGQGGIDPKPMGARGTESSCEHPSVIVQGCITMHNGGRLPFQSMQPCSSRELEAPIAGTVGARSPRCRHGARKPPTSRANVLAGTSIEPTEVRGMTKSISFVAVDRGAHGPVAAGGWSIASRAATSALSGTVMRPRWGRSRSKEMNRMRMTTVVATNDVTTPRPSRAR